MNSGNVDAIEHRCIHLQGEPSALTIYFIFRLNEKECFYVCNFCYAAILEQVISELKDIRIKVK